MIHKYNYKLIRDSLEDFDINMDIKELFDLLYVQAKKILPEEPKKTIFALLNPENSNDNTNANNIKCNASPKENTFSSRQYHKQKIAAEQLRFF